MSQCAHLPSRDAVYRLRSNPLSIEGDKMVTILVVLVVLMLLGVFPAWPHSRGWGYGPSGGLGLVLLIVLILLLTGRLWRGAARPLRAFTRVRSRRRISVCRSISRRVFPSGSTSLSTRRQEAAVTPLRGEADSRTLVVSRRRTCGRNSRRSQIERTQFLARPAGAQPLMFHAWVPAAVAGIGQQPGPELHVHAPSRPVQGPTRSSSWLSCSQ